MENGKEKSYGKPKKNLTSTYGKPKKNFTPKKDQKVN